MVGGIDSNRRISCLTLSTGISSMMEKEKQEMTDNQQCLAMIILFYFLLC